MTAPFTAREQSVVDRFANAPDAPESLRERVIEAVVRRASKKRWDWGDVADAAIAVITGGQS